MGVSVGENLIDEIKSRCNIVDVIGRVVPLKRAGNNYKGVCPFHNEKTPSFVVSDTKQIFTCFGCGATGDVIEFVKKYYNLDFMEAVEKLAGEYGITIEAGTRKSGNKEKLYEINREAARFFYKAFVSQANPGYEYMRRREIEPKVLQKFGIGYADGQWDSLYKHLTSMGFDKKTLLELGLISESKGKCFDKFRDRVIFPIINTNGKVIGFGGRTINDGTPKYLNSPETPVFSKKNNLYGLNLTRQEVSKENCAILVEGYMDVIALYQGGIRNVSASLGTALTENQARILKRYTGNVVLSYDSDGAGKNATLRGLDILYKEGCRAKALHVTDGKDPDEFIKKNGKNAYLKLVEEARPYADYKLWSAKANFNFDSDEERLEYLREAVAILKELKPVEADLYIKKVASEMKISEGAIRLEINGNNIQSMSAFESNGPKKFSKASDEDTHYSDNLTPLEKSLIRLIVTSSKYFERLKNRPEAFESNISRNIFEAMGQIYKDGEEIDLKKLEDILDDTENAVLQKIMDTVYLAGKEELIFNDCMHSINARELEQLENELIMKLSLADEEENQKKIKEYTEELMEVQKKIQNQKHGQGVTK